MMRYRAPIVAVWAFSLLPLIGQENANDVRNSLVTVHFSREFTGILHNNAFIPQIRVEEAIELEGGVVARGGYVISYIGSYWPEVNLPGVNVRFSVATCDGKQYPAELVGVDERISLLVLEVAGLTAPGLRLGGRVEQTSVQLACSLDREWKVASPVVANVGGDNFLPVHQIQVLPAGFGFTPQVSEGGMLLDKEGRLAGILTDAHTHPFSSKLQIWRFLPAAVLQESVRRIVRDRKNIKGGWLGVFLAPKEPQLRVKQVIPGSPAEKAGLQRDDVIVSVDGSSPQSRWDLVQMLRWKGADASLQLTISRRGREHSLGAVLGQRPDEGPRVSWRVEFPQFWSESQEPANQVKISRTLLPPHLNLGFAVEPVTEQLARFFRCPKDQGLLVKAVLADSPAERVGFRAGDVLIKLNDREIFSQSDVRESLQQNANGSVLIEFIRDGQLLSQEIVIH